MRLSQSQMADCDVETTSNLSGLERMLLWSMRAWVVGLHHPQARVLDRIAANFASLGVPEAAQSIDRFMGELCITALRPIGIRCPCKAVVDPDERVLLDVLALAQHGQGFEGRALLRSMISAVGANEAFACAVSLGHDLRAAGHEMTTSNRPAAAQFGLGDGSSNAQPRLLRSER